MSQQAGRKYRVTRRTDIAGIFEGGVSARDWMLTVLAARNGLPRARCMVAVSKRHGNAVRRNRIKRLCREAFRQSRAALPAGWDYVLLPKAGDVPSLAALRASVEALGKRAVAKGAQEKPAP